MTTKSSKAGNSTDRSPIHWAASDGNKELVRKLIADGADIDATDEMGWTPLMIACSAGHYDIVQTLVEHKADINAVNSTGQSALHYAASKDRLDIAKYLIDSGCHINLRDKLNQTPLHRSASRGFHKIVDLLLGHRDIQLNPQDVVGNTPLHLSCEEERIEVAKTLIKIGALTDIQNKEKKFAFDLCINDSVKRSLINYAKECQQTSKTS
ncbi:26S proteasome non-ATPase regulatory subunit 10-like [Oppia nitens]|uniref:26S proteasome non-ATPase regulatory subunit 10-like n=1 Tax=Oppia nitens TaxID=1686743 RepID=UPI0023DBBEB8|nr:26S proteasome non-ATPase regulatory subunit 10-like [Oppia nitens]